VLLNIHNLFDASVFATFSIRRHTLAKSSRCDTAFTGETGSVEFGSCQTQ